MNLSGSEPLRFEDWFCAVYQRKSLLLLHETKSFPKLGLTFEQWIACEYREWGFGFGVNRRS